MIHRFNPTPQDIVHIKALRAQGVILKDIAKQYHVSPSTIFNLLYFGRPFQDRSVRIIRETIEIVRLREQGLAWHQITPLYPYTRETILRRVAYYRKRKGIFADDRLLALAQQ